MVNNPMVLLRCVVRYAPTLPQGRIFIFETEFFVIFFLKKKPF